MTTHHVVGHGDWVAARKEHLAKEKEFTRLRDQLSRERRDMPWERVEKDHILEGVNGRQSLGEIFEGRSQLVIYHAMFSPETAGEDTSWTADAACHVCSFWMDNFNGITVHLNHRDITMAAISRAPFPKIAAYRDGWVDVPLVLLCRQRVQLRLRGLLHSRRARARCGGVQLPADAVGGVGGAGGERDRAQGALRPNLCRRRRRRAGPRPASPRVVVDEFWFWVSPSVWPTGRRSSTGSARRSS